MTTKDHDIEKRTETFLDDFGWEPLPANEPQPRETRKRPAGKKASPQGDLFEQTPAPDEKEKTECRAPAEKSEFDALDEDAQRFLRDVADERHEFDGLTQRFVRADVRSASRQQAILGKLQGAGGWIRLWPLAVGKGRPVKLADPTEKTLKALGLAGRKNRGRGVLPTRAATHLLTEKLRALPGWTVLPEGDLHGKQVDLLCRDEEGKLVTVEVAHTAAHEPHNARHCLRQGEVRRHAIVATSKAVERDVRRLLEKIEGLADDPRLEVLVLSQALLKKWKP